MTDGADDDDDTPLWVYAVMAAPIFVGVPQILDFVEDAGVKLDGFPNVLLAVLIMFASWAALAFASLYVVRMLIELCLFLWSLRKPK